MSGNRSAQTPARACTMGHGDAFRPMLVRRTAAANAAHLLPHLEPGLRVLDFGCGPGTISVGLAQAVAPGELHGIDIEAAQIEAARATAAAGGHDNAVFRTGDVTDLPFDDNWFDVAHCHAVLMHVPDTQAALAEVKRVLKPGGILSGREPMGDGTFFEPIVGNLAGAGAAFLHLIRANGGHPRMGRELKRRFIAAGFVDVRAGATFDFYDTTEDVHFFYGTTTALLFSPEAVEMFMEHGLASRDELDAWRRILERWRDTPGATAAAAWGEAVGRKPRTS